MESQEQVLMDAEQETPVCLKCMRPVDPLHYYCPYCGEASGQLTPYLPFINIAWLTRIWGQMWREMWSSRVGFWGRVLRFLMIVWNVPVMLIGLLFVRRQSKIESDTDIDES